MHTITLKEALWTIYDDTPGTFAITFTTANEKHKTGGDSIHIPRATRLANKLTPNQPGKTAIHTTTAPPIPGKSPHHEENGTINLWDCDTEKIIKIHTDLITKFNDKTIIW